MAQNSLRPPSPCMCRIQVPIWPLPWKNVHKQLSVCMCFAHVGTLHKPSAARQNIMVVSTNGDYNIQMVTVFIHFDAQALIHAHLSFYIALMLPTSFANVIHSPQCAWVIMVEIDVFRKKSTAPKTNLLLKLFVYSR